MRARVRVRACMRACVRAKLTCWYCSSAGPEAQAEDAPPPHRVLGTRQWVVGKKWKLAEVVVCARALERLRLKEECEAAELGRSGVGKVLLSDWYCRHVCAVE